MKEPVVSAGPKRPAPALAVSTRALVVAINGTQTAPDRVPDVLSDDPLITSGTARALAGGVASMTLWRWRKAGIIPEPIVIRGRNYFRRGEFLSALAAAGSTPGGQDAPGPLAA